MVRLRIAQEQGAFPAGADGGDFRHVVLGALGAQRAGFEVDDAGGRIEEPGIGVPLVEARGDPAVGAGELTTAATVLALASDLPADGLLLTAAASRAAARQMARERVKTSRVSSWSQIFPSKNSHLFQTAT